MMSNNISPKIAKNKSLRESILMISIQRGCKSRRIQLIEECLHLGYILSSLWRPGWLLYYFCGQLFLDQFSRPFQIGKEYKKGATPIFGRITFRARGSLGRTNQKKQFNNKAITEDLTRPGPLAR